jgi:ankyrin repeat protein
MTSPNLIDRIAAGRTDLVLDLLADGGNAACSDADGTRLIQWCAYYGDTSAVRLLLAHGEALETLGADLGLNGAAFHGHWQLCQFLLEHGARADSAQADTGETALHAALCSDDSVRHDPVVEVLLMHGASPHAATLPGVETGAFMRDCRTRGETALHRAAAFGSAAAIQMLLDAGARRETIDAHGDSALGWASWHRRPAEILRLLCYGPFHIHPQFRGMRAHLVGEPMAPAAD